MDNRVKEYIKLEISDVVEMSNFDEVYYVFEKIIDYDVASSSVAGIKERMSNALNKLACDKIDREDLISNMSTISHCIEPFVKKVLYLIDKEKYSEISSKKSSSLSECMEAIGVKVFVDKKNRTPLTDCIYYAYNNRNDESHECVKWSQLKLYSHIRNELVTLYVIVEKNIEKIKNALFRVGEIKELQYRKFDLSSFKNMCPNIMFRLFQYGVYNLESKIKVLKIGDGSFHFDKDGKVINCFGIMEDSIFKHCYEYEESEGKILSYKEVCENNYKGNISTYVSTEARYLYDSDDKVKSILIYYGKNNSKKDEIFFIYEADGGVKITRNHYRLEKLLYVENEGEFKLSQTITYIFDNTGKLIRIEGEDWYKRYEYDESTLVRLVNSSGEIIEVQTIADEQVYIQKKNDEDNGRIVKKLFFRDGLVIGGENYFENGEVNKCMQMQVEYY